MLPDLRRSGDRVWVRTVTRSDLAPYREAVLASAARLRRWNPVDPDDLQRHLHAQSPLHRTFVIHARDDEGSHGIVGKVNVFNIVRGRFQNGTLGYDAYDPYVGRGLFAEGLRLVVDLAFAAEPKGLALHRVDANVQPGNAASAGVLRSLGFRREARVPRMLWLSGADGRSDWRDHDAHAITAEEWPAPAYQQQQYARTAVIVDGPAGLARAEVAHALARELIVPCLAEDLVQDALAGLPLIPSQHEPAAIRLSEERLRAAGWALLAAAPAGAVLAGDYGDEPIPLEALRGAGIQPDRLTVVRMRRPREGTPTGPGHTLLLPETEPLTARDITRIALQARAIAAGVPPE